MTKKRMVTWLAVGTIAAGLVIWLLTCVAVRCTSFTEAGGCIAVVFDKHQVLQADRIVLREGDKTVTITDPEQVRSLAASFVVADRTDLCGYYMDRWMEIYHGDTLVRNIHWNDHDELVTVYESDATHLVLLPRRDIGQIYLSKETVNSILALLEE